ALFESEGVVSDKRGGVIEIHNTDLIDLDRAAFQTVRTIGDALHIVAPDAYLQILGLSSWVS
ncbi:MAG: hypothetical protein KZQ89_21125, partial [Candidatus Thiodiazotropha sp. (ex Lucinoma kastoroae)]|nr:hypothetical protein [Candidatus Thiodiazotropha sp. (ex Lucinoma kastoroae)]MCU7861509.1 hypothetical protein [Candidatus Thiodiazotropha sp. (ex Lucinoma kastoroae)]